MGHFALTVNLKYSEIINDLQTLFYKIYLTHQLRALLWRFYNILMAIKSLLYTFCIIINNIIQLLLTTLCFSLFFIYGQNFVLKYSK